MCRIATSTAEHGRAVQHIDSIFMDELAMPQSGKLADIVASVWLETAGKCGGRCAVVGKELTRVLALFVPTTDCFLCSC